MEKTPEKQDLDYIIHNCHCHLFNIDHIPLYFLNRWVPVTVVKNKWIANTAYSLFRNRLNRFSAFFYSALKITTEDILQELQSYYPETARFVPLTVDFDYMQAGLPVQPFEQQLADIAELKQKYPEVIFPFVGVDPRRPNVLQLVRKHIEELGFCGIKLYPALGFFPNDERLRELYAYAQENGIPITTHCIPKNPNHYRGKITQAQRKQAEEVPGYNRKETRRNYDFAMYFNHPYWYSRVADEFPKIKINLAHFGGNEEWDKYLDGYNTVGRGESWYSQIRNLINKYENIYADISFTVYDQRLYPVLKNLVKSRKVQDRVLFGSDFYMLQKDYRERRFGLDVRGYLDDDDYWKIAEINPKRFLTSAFHDFYSRK